MEKETIRHTRNNKRRPQLIFCDFSDPVCRSNLGRILFGFRYRVRKNILSLHFKRRCLLGRALGTSEWNTSFTCFNKRSNNQLIHIFWFFLWHLMKLRQYCFADHHTHESLSFPQNRDEKSVLQYLIAFIKSERFP